MRFASILTAFAFAGQSFAAPIDLAELFPADAPLFVEVRHPGKLTEELGALTRGTVLENSLKSVSKLREDAPEMFGVNNVLGTLGALLGPEMLAEAKRFGPFAFGITGYTKAHHAEYAFVLLTGESNVPGLLVRLYLTTQGQVRKLGAVEGIDLFQDVGAYYQLENAPLNPVFSPSTPNVAVGPVFAYVPGRLIVGSSKESVTAIIMRGAGKVKSASLAAATGLIESKELRETSTVFAYADPRHMLAHAVAQQRAKNNGIESIEWSLCKSLLNPEAVRWVAAGLLASKDGYTLLAQIAQDSGKPSPVLDLISTAKFSAAERASSLRGGGLALSLALPQDDKRAERLIRLADAAAQATGTLGIMPSEAIQELGKSAKLKVAEELLNKLTGISLLMPAARDWPTEGIPWPTLALHFEDDKAIPTAEASLPALLKILGLETPAPTRESINGVTIRSTAGIGVDGLPAIHIGSRSSSFAIGADRLLVAASLTPDGKSIAEFKDASLAALAEWGPLLRPLFGIEPIKTKKPARRVPQDEELPFAPMAPDPISATRAAFADMIRSFEAMPPAQVGVRRNQDVIHVNVQQPQARESLRKVVDKWVEWRSRRQDIGDILPFISDGASIGVIIGR